ncbi:zona pellucida glycoprotein 3f, tandem duplicate 2 [Centropristis striata]|uniref:zona pellucida glycoprotein 3f, tandem duplicate 2 n=1 Tax=Centropristis striata TaxID=184440 RepID=UPI0027E152A7|nr:zona pellucida glycoprotein 3f, tandem duplicate 2 [Centropristis striata]
MVTPLVFGLTILVVFATTVANADIEVVCGRDSVSVSWRISADMVPHASRLFLGSCMASKLNRLPSGDGVALFNYQFADCKFKKLMKGKRLFYQSELTFRPQAKPKPAAFVYPVECVYKRPEGWVPPFLMPASGVSEGRGQLVFHMALLDDQLTGVAKSNVVPLGSFMPIWAAVEQKSHQPLLLLMEECVAATTPELHSASQVHPIISNKGCLLESVRSNSVFLPRYHSSAVVLYLQSFKFGHGDEMYIHCKLVAWDPDSFDESKKTCQYSKENGRWELLDDSFQSSVCSCCDSVCHSRSRRGVEWESHGVQHNSVLGPLIITDPKPHNGSEVSFSPASLQRAQSKLKDLRSQHGGQ